MTMMFPGSMIFAGSPSFPWTPEVIEELPEWERKAYASVLNDTRKHLAEVGAKQSKR